MHLKIFYRLNEQAMHRGEILSMISYYDGINVSTYVGAMKEKILYFYLFCRGSIEIIIIRGRH